MKLVHSKIEKPGRTNSTTEQSKFVRGIRALGRELSGFAGVAVLATGISTVLLFSSCGSSSTVNPTPKIEDVSIQDQSRDSDASSYFSYCPDKDKRVYGNGPDPITTLQIWDKINLDENNYLEFVGVNAEGKAVFNIKSKSTDDLVGLVVLGQGEQKTITSADGSTTLVLEACTIGIYSVTIGANTKLVPYSPQTPDVSSDTDEGSQDVYEAPDVQVEYNDAQTDYGYEVAVDGSLTETSTTSSCTPTVESWCDGVNAQLIKGAVLELPDCYSLVFEDISISNSGVLSASFQLKSPEGKDIKKYDIPENVFPFYTLEDPESGASYRITVNDMFAGYTFLSAWVDITAKPSKSACESECDYSWPGPFSGIYGVGEPITVFKCIQFTVEEVSEPSYTGGKSSAILNWSDTSDLLGKFNLYPFDHEDVSFVIVVDGEPFEMSVRIGSLMLAPSSPSDSWAELIFSRNTDTEICTSNPDGLIAESTALGESQSIKIGWDSLEIDSLPPDNEKFIEFGGSKYPITLGDSIIVQGSNNNFYQVAFCDYNEATSTYWVQVFAVK